LKKVHVEHVSFMQIGVYAPSIKNLYILFGPIVQHNRKIISTGAKLQSKTKIVYK
jgi:hypothetical protein